jgi:hypothetical protein
MGNAWQWMGRNTKQLQGAAAVAIILGALAALPSFLSRIFRTDLQVRVARHKSTVPQDLLSWSQSAGYQFVAAAAKAEAKALTDTDEWKKLSGSPVREKLRDGLFQGEGISLLEVEIQNQSDHTVSGVRARADGVGETWGATLSGTFLTPDEVAAFQNKIVPTGYSTLVLPELPSLPPGGVLNIRLYVSDAAFAKPAIAVQNASVKMVESVEVDDSWLIWFYRMPGKGFIFTPVLAYFGITILVWWIERWRERRKSRSYSQQT